MKPALKHTRSAGGIQVIWMVVILIITVVSLRGLAWGDDLAGPLPMPPVPEDVRSELVVQPVSLEIATPLPIDGSHKPGMPASSAPSAPAGAMGNWSVLAAIASAFIVLAGFRFWQARRGTRALPSDVFEVLGEAPLGGQHAVRVVRFGPRTLLVGVSSAGCQTLATLDDPQATERIVSACLGSRSPRPIRVPARPPQAVGGQGSGETR